jgi:hypothetical protein
VQKKRDRREYNRQWYLAHRESEIVKNRKYYAENTEFCKALVKDWRAKNPEKVRQFGRDRTARNLDQELAKIRKWKLENWQRAKDAAQLHRKRRYWKDPESARKERKDATRQLKIETIQAYGGKCTCCGETIIEFLTIDHIRGGGTQHIRSLQRKGTAFYGWLKQQGFPQDDYQCHCWNCNCAKGMFGVCPHQRDRVKENSSGLRSRHSREPTVSVTS